MSKIAIVGVDASGKTVLMAALGEAYERPDKNGILLSAKTPQTFDMVKVLMDKMRHGDWPPATELDNVVSLDWRLCRRVDGRNMPIGEISFLDYAGEIYRLAFGERSEEERDSAKAGIESLRSHITASNALIILVNLKDIINGSDSNPRTREMKWITKRIIDFAVDECGVARVAIAFTQFETYRDIVAASGGLECAYKKFLGHVEGFYPNLRLMAVSAVDKVVCDKNGKEIPASDFSSQGLDDMMAWIVEGVEDGIRRERELAAQRSRCLRRRKALGVLATVACGIGFVVTCIMSDNHSHEREYVPTSSSAAYHDEQKSTYHHDEQKSTYHGEQKSYCNLCGGTGLRPCTMAGSYWGSIAGWIEPAHVSGCTACRGRGFIPGPYGPIFCVVCGGRGETWCQMCSGTGSVPCYH